jgi:hypothetical protein
LIIAPSATNFLLSHVLAPPDRTGNNVSRIVSGAFEEIWRRASGGLRGRRQPINQATT